MLEAGNALYFTRAYWQVLEREPMRLRLAEQARWTLLRASLRAAGRVLTRPRCVAAVGGARVAVVALFAGIDHAVAAAGAGCGRLDVARPAALDHDAGDALVVPRCGCREAEVGVELAGIAEAGILEALKPLETRGSADRQGRRGGTRSPGAAAEVAI